MSILDYFEEEKITISYTPAGTTTYNPTTGQNETVPGTPAPMRGLFWDRSAASRYFSEQISAAVESYFIPEDSYASSFWNIDGTPKKTGSISLDGSTFEIATVQNVAYMDYMTLVGLKAKK